MIKLTSEMYRKEIAPALKEKFGWSNVNQVPVIKKVTLNVGLGKGLKDSRFTDAVEATLTRIAGQKPVKTLAKKSIATFKIRQGMPVGMIVTLRGKRMWAFIDKLNKVAFPRVRDFRGIGESAIDKAGNFSYGFREQLAFPEVGADEAEIPHGVQVTITTTCRTQKEGLALFTALGFPFAKKDGKNNK